KLTRTGAGGTEVITDVLAPGDLLGALSTLGEPTYAESAVALTTTCALRIGPAAFREVLTEHPAVELRVLDDLAVRLARARSDAGRSGESVAARVASVLLRLADRMGQERPGGGVLIQVPLSRADLAAMAGSTPESVSRVMSRWRSDGL